MSSAEQYTFGYIPDSPDERDFKFKLTLATDLLESVDLREYIQPIKNQGNLGACTAFATTALVEFVRNKQQFKKWDASPLFTYYSTRKIENSITQDSGAQCRNALKSVVKDGVTKEEIWPYNIAKFTENPPEHAWVDAEKHQALVYYSVDQTKENILGCLAEGYPFTFGMMLYQSFADTQCSWLVDNYLPMPNTSTERFLGGHCMLAVGYTTWNNRIYIIVRNSWGPNVGLSGYHNIPLDYFLDRRLSMDFWTIRSEEMTEEDITPTPTSSVTPTPTYIPPTPTPTSSPTPPFIPLEDQKSIWKRPSTYFIIAFILAALIMALAPR